MKPRRLYQWQTGSMARRGMIYRSVTKTLALPNLVTFQITNSRRDSVAAQSQHSGSAVAVQWQCSGSAGLLQTIKSSDPLTITHSHQQYIQASFCRWTEVRSNNNTAPRSHAIIFYSSTTTRNGDASQTAERSYCPA